VRSAIDPESHLWFALAVSLALHGLFLTALALKSRWMPIYHPAVYGVGNGFSVVQFFSAPSEDPAKDAGPKGEDTPAPDVVSPSLPSARTEASENPSVTEDQPVEQAAIELSASPEAQLTEDSAAAILQSAPITAGAATGEPSGVGGAANRTSTGGSDGEDSNRIGTGSGTAEPGGGGDSHGIPAYLRNPKPPYPRVAREHGWEGTTLLQVEVLDDGRGRNVEILKSSGHEILDEAAAKTVRHWRFLPARSGNTPIRSTVEIPIRFRIEGNTQVDVRHAE
jgi:protein TonB